MGQPTVETRRFEDAIGEEYAVVSYRSWGAVSISLFVATVLASYLLRRFPIGGLGLSRFLFLPGLALGGLTAGVWGLRSSEHRASARTGIFLNAVALVSVLALIGGFLYVRYIR